MAPKLNNLLVTRPSLPYLQYIAPILSSPSLVFSIHRGPTCCTSREAPKNNMLAIVLPRKLLLPDIIPDPRPTCSRTTSAGDLVRVYLWQIDVGNNNAVQSARGILRRVLWVSAWVILVPAHCVRTSIVNVELRSRT
jgi:hypothetical protein